jgi:hypothetical protein
VDALARAFIARTLPTAAWTHHAHLRVGLWHLRRHPPETALALLRDRIRAFNAAHGGENSATAGYHETITRFYVLMIADVLARADATDDEDALADALIAGHGDRDLPLRHWSRDVLFAPAARLGWVPPDLVPLP